ncbi:MAG: RQC domain-containing protein, partial [Gammaproteobacteria bacterium]|nr:RQC domain-containing protein [Gammaproteobacteria bacterium]
LLGYFDEEASERCGNCDNCLRPPQKWEATKAAQMALSCVYRTEQSFGVSYIVDILLGKVDERIQRNGHDQISTFGIGKKFSVAEWRVVMRQLIAIGFLEIDIEHHGALRLTEKCRPVLRGEQTLQLRKMEKQEKQVSTKKGKQAVRPQDEALWEALHALRLSLAEKAGVPPYVIFHDATLQEMLKVRPTNLNDMNRITGVGEQKLERFGKKFIDEIAKFPLSELLDNTLSKTVNETLMLYQQGKTIDQIIKQRELTSTTVYTHLSEAIEMGLLDVKEVLEMDEKKYDEIVFAIESFGDDEERRLKPVFEALDGAYDYGLLRCVQASI